MSLATLRTSGDSLAITDAHVVVPLDGIWHADVATATAPAAAPSAVTVAIADLSLVGTVVRGDGHEGSYRARIVGGKAGWRRTVPARSYRHSAGVKRSTVLGDVAREVGETLHVMADASLGDAFVRQEGPAVRVLAQVLGADWYVDTDGTTVTGGRPAGTVAGPYAVIDYAADIGRAMVAADAIAEWLPGRTIGVGSLAGKLLVTVTHRIAGGSLRTEVAFA